ncbi:MAG TPA: hypothetical protein VF660_11995 [Actinomycetota bacterium]
MGVPEIAGGVLLLLFMLAATAVAIGPIVWGLIDVGRTPDGAWIAGGHKKNLWIVVFALGLWAWPVGLIGLVVYLMKVRPDLRRVVIEQNYPQPRLSSGAKRGLLVGRIAFSALWLIGGWIYINHGHKEFLDAALAQRANVICAEAKADLANQPPLSASPTYAERADRVERSVPVYEAMLRRLRSLSPRGRNGDYDHWLDVWNEFISVARPYADAIRTGDPKIYVPVGNRGDRPATEVNEIAEANRMPACIF